MSPVRMVRENDPTEGAPRYRLDRMGAQALTTDELMHVVSGVPVEDCTRLLVLADRSVAVLSQAGTMQTYAQKVSGIGEARVLKLLAAIELGKRAAAEARDQGAPLRSPRDVVAVMEPSMRDLPQEEFRVLALDAQHRLTRDILITRGLLNSSLAHPREVFREAIAYRAAAVILCHNHPSGDPTPSAEDKAVTAQLVAAGRLLDIPVHDHVIIGRGRYVSFAESGLL